MMNALIIDDEKDARFLIKNHLQSHFSDAVTVVGEADDVASGVQAIRKLKPEIVFLDIKMPAGTGFEVLQQTQGEVNYEVVFITAHNDFAVKAFQFSAVGYLLKPVKVSELAGVLQKVRELSQLKNPQTLQRNKVLVENYSNDLQIKKMVVTNSDGFVVLNVDTISHLEGDGNYTHFVLNDGKRITTSKTLGEYEGLLAEQGFFRVHQSTIISLRYVKSYKKSEELIEMQNGKLVKLSRHRKQAFISRFI